MVATPLTDNQFLYSYLIDTYGLSSSEIALAFGDSRQNVHNITKRARKSRLQNEVFVNFQRQRTGGPAKITQSRQDRSCPCCGARYNPPEDTTEPRRDFEFVKGSRKTAGKCYNCDFSFEDGFTSRRKTIEEMCLSR